MFNGSIVLLTLVLACYSYGKSDVQIIADGLETIETIGQFEILKRDCNHNSKIANDKTHPLEKIGSEVDLLKDLFDNYYRCKEQERILSAIEYQAIKNGCDEISLKLDQKQEELNQNFISRTGVGIECQTENDNTPIGDKNGDDQGDTASHWCRFTYFTKSGARYSTGVSSELFNDIISRSLDGVHDFDQVSVERIKIEGLYEWVTNPKTRIGAGAYISKVVEGRNDTFGAALQNRWHSLNDLYLFNNIGAPDIGDLPLYGGGVIGTINHVIVEKNGDFYDYRINAKGKLEIGLEGKNFRGDFLGGIQAQGKIEPLKRKAISPYIGLQADITNQSVIVGDEARSDVFWGVGLKAGTNINLKSGAQVNIEASAADKTSLIKDREHSTLVGDQGEARTSNIGSQQFSVQFRASLRLPPRDLNRKQRKVQYLDMVSSRTSIREALNKSDDLVEVVRLQDLLKAVDQRILQLEKIDPRLRK